MTEEVLVAFSGGVESTALLHYCVEKYGKDSVIALTTCVVNDNNFAGHRPQKFYAQKITEYYSVRHHIVERNVPPNTGKFGMFSVFLWGHDALMYCLGNRNVTRFVSGVHSKEHHHHQASLLINLFKEVIAYNHLKTIREHPLENLSKKEQWDMIPPQVQQWVWYCSGYLKRTVQGERTLSYEKCGRCPKCKEFTRLVNV